MGRQFYNTDIEVEILSKEETEKMTYVVRTPAPPPGGTRRSGVLDCSRDGDNEYRSPCRGTRGGNASAVHDGNAGPAVSASAPRAEGHALASVLFTVAVKKQNRSVDLMTRKKSKTSLQRSLFYPFILVVIWLLVKIRKTLY